MGHKERFLSPRLSGGYGLGQGTFARSSGNERDAPIAAIHQAIGKRRHATRTRPCVTSPSRTFGGVTRYRWFESGSLQRRVNSKLGSDTSGMKASGPS